MRDQQTVTCKRWRLRLEEITTGAAAKFHALIRETVGFQVPRGNALDEQRKLSHIWAIWNMQCAGLALVWPDFGHPHRPSADAMRSMLSSFHGTGLEYDSVPPRRERIH